MNKKPANKKFILLVTALIVIGVAVIFTAAFAKREIAASIGDEKITKEELNDVLVQRYGKATLDGMIDDKIIELEMKKEKISVPKQDIEKELSTYVEQYGGEDAFKAALEQSGMTKKDFEQDIEQYIALKKMLEPRIKITEKEMKDYFKENKESFNEEEQVKASHILVKDEKTAKEVEDKIAAGEDFAKLAKKYSTDTASKENGGDLGYFGKGKMVKEFEDAAFSMKEGEISDPVKSEHGYHIIKVTGKKAAKEAKYEDHKDEIKEKLFESKFQAEYPTWLQEKKDKYKVKNTLS